MDNSCNPHLTAFFQVLLPAFQQSRHRRWGEMLLSCLFQFDRLLASTYPCPLFKDLGKLLSFQTYPPVINRGHGKSAFIDNCPIRTPI